MRVLLMVCVVSGATDVCAGEPRAITKEVVEKIRAGLDADAAAERGRAALELAKVVMERRDNVRLDFDEAARRGRSHVEPLDGEQAEERDEEGKEPSADMTVACPELTSVVGRLCEMVRTEPSGDVRVNATLALAEIAARTEKAVMALCDAALRDEDPGVRRNAVAGFANYRSEARCAVDELLKGVECESWRDRTYAAVALALIGTPKCREAVAATAGRARKASAENRIEVAKVVRTLDAEWMAVIVPQLCDAVGAEIASLDREAAKREKAEGG